MGKLGIVALVWAACLGSWGSEASFHRQIESDWLLQEEVRVPVSGPVTPETDAAGAVDGVINGLFGCHTAHETAPWWQVDLGASVPLGRVVLWNRCDGAAERLAKVSVLLSEDGEIWRTSYTHDGKVFYGNKNKQPLSVELPGQRARFVRLQIPGPDYLHLDEVQVYGADKPDENLALHKPACQSSVGEWSVYHGVRLTPDWAKRVRAVLEDCSRLLSRRMEDGLVVEGVRETVLALQNKLDTTGDQGAGPDLYLEARWQRRALALADPLLDSDAILFAKRVPGSFSHMSDQYYGWWSRPGGGLYVLTGLRTAAPEVTCITTVFNERGSFLRPMIDFSGRKVLFAWCRYYEGLAEEQNKFDKSNVPEDAFYHIFEMNADGTGLRQLTHGKYDDFDARYLPDGRIVFLSTRRGQAIQCGEKTAALTGAQEALPDCYVRCGGGPERPVAVYTLHTMDTDGGRLCAISPFEMFEWTPAIAHDGTILYSRWDYVDRYNMPYMSLWSCHPDGTHPRVVYGNYTASPHCTFEPRPVPNSNKIIFTASGHHAQTMGSLVLLDTAAGTEGAAPIRRLTPEVVFPEIEGWPTNYFAGPWPISEELYLVTWGVELEPQQGLVRPPNSMGLYLFDASGFMELLHRDPLISCHDPVALSPTPRPPVIPDMRSDESKNYGTFVLSNVYNGLKTVRPGEIAALRIVAVPPKTHPTMNYPEMGLIKDDPGKCVLGTVPVEPDGSAHFRAPAGVTLFFQALDGRGMAVQTMRGAAYVQPGQTLSCAGCHESRHSAPPVSPGLAARRAPSPITPGPDGSWPYRFDTMIQPVLERRCVACHRPDADNKKAARFDLTAKASYRSLTGYGRPSVAERARAQYLDGYSKEGDGLAANSTLLQLLLDTDHYGVTLTDDDVERFVTWLDTYAQRLGSFSGEQELVLLKLKEDCGALLSLRPASVHDTARL